MTEKRFECYDLIFDGFIKDTLTNENIVEPIKLIYLLNELNDESEQLKEQLKLIRKDLTHIMLLLLNDEIVKQLSDYDMKVFERLSKA